MDASVAAYIDAKYQKLRLLKNSDKCEVWLALGVDGKLVVLKRIFFTGLPYKLLKENPASICPQIIYVSEDEGETVVVEEFIQGKSFAEILEEKHSLTEKQTQNILLRLCDGLTPIHKQGIIHRDIKPSNLILENGGAVRLIDFDAARTVKDDAKEDTRLLGTKGYAPPEQFGYGQTDERSDIYSLGITMKKMLGGSYTGYLNKILDKCSEIDPAKRYASALELKGAILAKSKRKKIIVGVCSVVAIFAFLFAANYDVSQNVNDDTKQAAKASEEMLLQTTAAAEKIPANKETQKPQEIVAKRETTVKKEPKVPTQPAATIMKTEPKTPTVTKAEKPLSGTLYINGQGYNNKIEVKRGEWKNYAATLRVANNTNSMWNNPKLRVEFKDNYGTKHTEILTLPPVAPGNDANFVIPLGAYALSERERLFAWLQLYLDTENLPSEESYWCAQFEIVGEI